MDIDLMPILEPAVQMLFVVLGIVLTALASWAIKKFSDKLEAEETEMLLSYVESMIDKGMVIAKKKTLEDLRKSSWSDASIKEGQLAFVVQYVVNQAPVYMTKLKLDEDKLTALIESKL